MDFAELPPAATSARDTHELRLDGPQALLQAVPYLLGFHPRDSLVLVGVGAGSVRVTARLDLADAVRPGPVDHAGDVLARAGATSVVAAVYDDVTASGQSLETVVTGLVPAVAAAGCELVDTYLVRCGRWWSRNRDGSGWGSGSGEPVDDPPTAFAAAATVAGLTALPSREKLVAALDPCDEHEREALRPMIAAIRPAASGVGTRAGSLGSQRSLTREVFAAARRADHDAPMLADHDLARLAAALSVTAVRDSAWLAVDDGVLDGRRLWAELARRLPCPYDVPALFLYGWACWRRGDGASAQTAVQRALAGGGAYPAAELLQVALAHGLDPRLVPRLRRRRRGKQVTEVGRTRGR